MRNLIIALIFLGIGHTFAIDTTGVSRTPKQSQPIIRGQGLFWSDSLWNGKYVLPVDSQFYAADTIVVLDTLTAQASATLNVNFDYDWLTITAQDSGTTYDDSCIVEFKTPNGTWQPVQFMRDSSWTNTNGRFIVDDASVKSYKIFIGDYEVIRVRMLNAELVENRVWRFWAQASHKR